MKREAKFQSIFNQYLRNKRLHGVFELKQTITDSLPFSALELHQKESLIASMTTGIIWKLSDQDQREKPFDVISSPPLTAYVVIKYPDFFCIIYAPVFIKESQDSKRRSLTSERAKELAVVTVYN
jgi:hypothetical protein